jgi:hypothetical protein
VHDERRQFVGFAVISAMDIVLLEIFIFSILWQIRRRTAERSMRAEPLP